MSTKKASPKELGTLLSEIIQARDIEYVFISDPETEAYTSPIEYTEPDDTAEIISTTNLFTEELSHFELALLNEVSEVLTSDLGLSTNSDSIFRLEDYKLSNVSSNELPMSAKLLAADFVCEKLSELAKTHDLMDGKAISSTWLKRSYNSLIASNQIELMRHDKEELKSLYEQVTNDFSMGV